MLRENKHVVSLWINTNSDVSSAEQFCADVLKMAGEARSHRLGVFHPTFSLLRRVHDSLLERLPEDAHLKASGKLCVSLTRVADGKNVLVSEFDSRDELIQVKQERKDDKVQDIVCGVDSMNEPFHLSAGSHVQLLFSCLLWFHSTVVPWSGE